MKTFEAKQDIFSPYTGRKLFAAGKRYKQISDPAGEHDVTLQCEPVYVSGVRYYSLDGNGIDLRGMFMEVESVFKEYTFPVCEGGIDESSIEFTRCGRDMVNVASGYFGCRTFDAPLLRKFGNLFYKVARELEK